MTTGDEEQFPEGTEIPEGISEEMNADDYQISKKTKKMQSSGRSISAMFEHPTAVNTKEQLAEVPAIYLSDNPKRPLLFTVEGEGERPPYTYALNPLTYCVLAILTIEALERFAYYGTSSIQIYIYVVLCLAEILERTEIPYCPPGGVNKSGMRRTLNAAVVVVSK